MGGPNTLDWADLRVASLASVAAMMLAVGSAHAQATRNDLTKVSGREYLRLCTLTENEHPCLQAVYASATVNRLLDAIKNQRTFCPPAPNTFPPADIVSRVATWLGSHPTLLDKPSEEALSAALMAMYPCR